MNSITKAKIAIGISFAIPFYVFLPFQVENITVFICNILFGCLLLSCDKQLVPKSLKYGLLFMMLVSALHLLNTILFSANYATAVATAFCGICALVVFINSKFPQGIKILILIFFHCNIFDRMIFSHIGMTRFLWYAGFLYTAFFAAAIFLLQRWKDGEIQTFDKQNKFLRVLNNQGSIGRKSYLLSLLCFLIVYSCSMFLVSYCVKAPVLIDYIPLFDPFLNISTLFIIAQGSKRCHDLGKSGWYQFIPFNFHLLFKKGRK